MVKNWKKGGMIIMQKEEKLNKVYVDYMHKIKGFRPDRKYFKTYEGSTKNGEGKNLKDLITDMIGYTEFARGLDAFAKGGKTQGNGDVIMIKLQDKKSDFNQTLLY